MREHPPIPVIDLADHIERLKANDGLRFSQEYEVSGTLKQHRSTPFFFFLNNVDVMSAMFACNFHVYAFDPYKCILMDYESLFPHKFL